jgi:hypothetical protein
MNVIIGKITCSGRIPSLKEIRSQKLMKGRHRFSNRESLNLYILEICLLRLDRSTARYIYRDNKILLVDLSIHAQEEKCLFNYSTNTLFYKDLFLTIINCYIQDFVKSAIFQRKVHVS